MARRRHTEESLLSSYLLPPSSLPTIIPLSTFFNYHKPGSTSTSSSSSSSATATATTTVSTTLNPATARALKKLYRDLQFQRQIDVDTVRLNIERECRRGKVLKARLKGKVRAELQDAGQGGGRKRKFAMLEEEEEEDVDDHDDNDNEDDELEDVGGERIDPVDDPREMALDDKFFGPNGAVLPVRSRRYHTTTSLLAAMESSINDLEREIANLDGQSDEILREMNDTVSALSELQYGKSPDTEVESEVIAALNEFTNTVNHAVREAKSAVT